MAHIGEVALLELQPIIDSVDNGFVGHKRKPEKKDCMPKLGNMSDCALGGQKDCQRWAICQSVLGGTQLGNMSDCEVDRLTNWW